MAGDAVYRALSARGLEDFLAFRSSGLADRLVAEGRLVETEDSAGVPVPEGFAALLRHERVPFVSYPYEWPFSMLQDAALLQLDLLLAALDHGLMLKDATPYNIQWSGSKPVFIDVGSFERLRDGEPWAGYRQFCMLFLYPLLLEAYRGIDSRPLLRGRLEGISPRECRRMLSARDALRRGVLTHVVLHARLEARYADRRRDIKQELQAAGFKSGLIRANVRRLRRLIGGLELRRRRSEWTEYAMTTSYDDADAQQKEAFVRSAVGDRRWKLVWDLGCNDGRYARIAAEHADGVVAIDTDETVVDRLYQDLREAEETRVLPLTLDLVDPSPALGWRGRERSDLAARGRPDLVLCLALVHHLAITRNIPLTELVDWLASLGATVVVEFPTAEDEMVRRLLTGKRSGMHADYTVESFERELAERFSIERREELGAGTRFLYVTRPR